jgi:hypothetical protein
MPIEFGSLGSISGATIYSTVIYAFITFITFAVFGVIVGILIIKLRPLLTAKYKMVIVDHKGLNTAMGRFDYGDIITEDGVKKLKWYKLKIKTEPPSQDFTFPISARRDLAFYFRDKSGILRAMDVTIDEDSPLMRPDNKEVAFWAQQERKRVMEQHFKPKFWDKYGNYVMFAVTISVCFLMLILTIDFAEGATKTAGNVASACSAVLRGGA